MKTDDTAVHNLCNNYWFPVVIKAAQAAKGQHFQK